MLRFIHWALMTVTLIVAFGSPSFAQAPQGQRIGLLTCKLAPSIGLLIGSQQRMACRFVPDGSFPAEFMPEYLADWGSTSALALVAFWRGVFLRRPPIQVPVRLRVFMPAQVVP